MTGPAHLHTDTAVVQRYISRSGEGGDPVYATETEQVAGRIEPKIRVVTNTVGKKRNSSHVWQTTIELKELDRIWIPGRDVTKQDQALEIVAGHEASPPDKSFTLYEYALGK